MELVEHRHFREKSIIRIRRKLALAEQVDWWRVRGRTFVEIGKEMGFSASYAQQLYRWLLRVRSVRPEGNPWS